MDTPTSIRKVRFDARRDVNAALTTLFDPVRTNVAEFAQLLAGQPGMTVDQQQTALKSAASACESLAADLECMDVDAAVATLAEVSAALNAAANFAADRDFDAHQAAKQAAGEGALPALDGSGFVTPDDAIGDLIAAEASQTFDA